MGELLCGENEGLSVGRLVSSESFRSLPRANSSRGSESCHVFWSDGDVGNGSVGALSGVCCTPSLASLPFGDLDVSLFRYGERARLADSMSQFFSEAS